jgi:predicted Zn-dependent protease
MHPITQFIQRTASLIALLAAALVAGCGGGGSSSGGGLSIGQFIGGKNGQYADAALKGASALAMNESDEDELGRSVAIAATNKWRLYDNPALTKYVTLVGLTLADSTSRPDGNWVFGVLDTPEIGAFSGPNGYIMVTRGAINTMQDESELAAVLAHEMSHVLDHDGLNAVKNAKLVSAGTDAMSASDQRLAAFNQASNHLVDTILTSGYNQDQETKADKGAVKLLIATGYDPMGLPRFLKRMQAAQHGQAKPFGTHPGTADRIERTTSQIGSAQAGATNRDRFAKMAAAAKL